MNKELKEQDEFGCEACWPAAAGAAWKALEKMPTRANPVDESHFMVKVLQCPACSQSFVTVFTETVDWIDGEDPQYRTAIPLLEEEAVELAAATEGIEKIIRGLHTARPSLKSDFPKGGDLVKYWSHGISVGIHD